MAVSILRTLILYAVVIFAVRIMGKRQIGEMQPSELVVTIMISNIATTPMEDISTPVITGAVPILVLTVIEVALSFFMLHSTRLRELISGSPIVVIKNGKIMQYAMKQMRLTTDDILEELRKNSIFDISQVRYAIVETDGSLSVLQQNGQLPATLNDLGIVTKNDSFYAAVISDGKPLPKALRLMGKDENWLNNILKTEKCKLCEVFLMTCNTQGEYNIVKKESNK